MSNSEIIAKIQHFSFRYALGDRFALNSIDLTLFAGEIVVVCGPSGCGKTTLLRHLKREIAPAGEQTGRIDFALEPSDVGMVTQDPDTQLVLSSIIHDLAFPMENLGIDEPSMQKRMAETVSFFGIEDLIHRAPDTLSGGQKQLCALCSELMTYPKLLILDEPVSQLDPIAARDFLDMLTHINEEFGITIVLSEHRLSDVVTIADRLVLMKDGAIEKAGIPAEVLRSIWKDEDRTLSKFIPQIPLSSLTLSEETELCLSPRQFQKSFPASFFSSCRAEFSDEQTARSEEMACALKHVSFRYDDGEYVLRDFSLSVPEHEFFCLLGGNGSGKSTVLKLLAGFVKPCAGSLKRRSKTLAYIPQTLSSCFLYDSVEKELYRFPHDAYSDEILNSLSLESLMQKHPFDLSGGEQQKVALAAALLKQPDIILLDEPTRGLDPPLKRTVARLLRRSGATVIMSTHDLEFAAAYADRCAMLFDGQISYSDHPRAFFGGSRYYTTALSKAFRHINKDVILYKDVLKLCEKEPLSFLQDYSS